MDLFANGQRRVCSPEGWGADYTRLVRIQPTQDLEPGALYTARLREGAELIGGGTSTAPWEVTFQVACEAVGDPLCPDVFSLPEPSIDGIPMPPEGVEARACGCEVASAPMRWAPWALFVAFIRRRR